MDFKYQINSVDGGIGPSYHLMNDNQYVAGIGIDPESALNQSINDMASMIIYPTAYSKFSGGKISSAQMWILNNNKDTNLYTYGNELTKYDSSFNETVSSVSAGNGSGATYYNNYIFFATSADIGRYGPLDGTATLGLSSSFWTSAAPGAAQSTLRNVSYPSVHNMTYPNHPMHVHVDGKLYFGDSAVAISGISAAQGIINSWKTQSNGTTEGASTASTAYATLKLPLGYFPMSICSYGNDLAVVASQLSNYTAGVNFKSGNSALFLWDTFSNSFYRQIDIPDPLATAVVNMNGQLRIFSGMIDSYVRITSYAGGNSLIPVDLVNSGSPPPAGAVDSMGNMLAWGGYGNWPSTFAGVMTKGYRSPNFDPTARNVIGRYTGTGTSPIVTAINFIDKSQYGFKNPFMAWLDGNGQGIDRKSGSTFNTVFRTKVYNIGQEFEITRIVIPFVNTVRTGTNIVVTLYTDNENIGTVLATINNTNYPGAQYVTLKPTAAKGNTNFLLEFADTSTSLNPITFPITINGRTLKDNE